MLTIAATDKREIIRGIAVEWLESTQTCILVSRMDNRSLAAELRRYTAIELSIRTVGQGAPLPPVGVDS